jgi:hypothetical protein
LARQSAVATDISVTFVAGAPFSFADGATTNVSKVELLSMTMRP